MQISKIPTYHYSMYKLKKKLPINNCDNVTTAMVDKENSVIKVVDDLGKTIVAIFEDNEFNNLFEDYK